MAYKVWTFDVGGGDHKVELEHGEISGNRSIRIDGALMEQSNKWFDTGSDHQFEIGGHAAVLSVILPSPLSVHHEYRLTIDGREVTPAAG